MVSTRGKRVPSAAARDAAASVRREREIEHEEQQQASTPEPTDALNGDETIGSRLRRKRRRDATSPAASRSPEQRKRKSTQRHDTSPSLPSPNTPSASAAPKRRGRPPKNKTKVEESPAPVVAKRGPGRPRKNKLEVPDDESNGARKRRKSGIPSGPSRRRASSLSRSSEIGEEIVVQTPTSPGPGRRRFAAAIASPHRPPPVAVEQSSSSDPDPETTERNVEQKKEQENEEEPEQKIEEKPEESTPAIEPTSEPAPISTVEPVPEPVPELEPVPALETKPEPASEQVVAPEPQKVETIAPETAATTAQDPLRPGPAVTILKIIDYCAEVDGLKKLGREYGRGMDTDGMPTEGAPQALKVEALAILQELAEQLLHAFATIRFPELASYVVERDSVGGKAYARLKQLFDDTKKVYATKDHFLILEEIGDLRQDATSVARKANLATFATSCFGSGDVGFYHLDRYYLDVVALEGSRLLKQQASLFLELKTQAFVSAMHADGRPAYQLIQEIFPADLEQKLLQRRPGAKALAQSELEFIRQLRLRKEELKQIYIGAIPLDEKRKKLREHFPWDKFLMELCGYVSKNFDSIVGKQPADLKPLHESGLSLSPKASHAGLISDGNAVNGHVGAAATETSHLHPPPPPYMTPGFQPPSTSLPPSNKSRQRPTPHPIDTGAEQGTNAQPSDVDNRTSDHIAKAASASNSGAPSTELRSPRYQSYADRALKSPHDQPVSPRNFPPITTGAAYPYPSSTYLTTHSTPLGAPSGSSSGPPAYAFPHTGPHVAPYNTGTQSSYVSPFAPQQSAPNAPSSSHAPPPTGAPHPSSSAEASSQGFHPYYAAFQRPHSQQSKPTHELYEEARRIANSKNSSSSRSRPSSVSQRRPWTTEEETALMAGLDTVKGPHWSSILAMYGKGGSINEALKGRNQVQLKDKARNLKLFFLKSGIEVPYYLQFVTGDLKRASLPGQSTPPPEGQPAGAGQYADSDAARRVSMPARLLGAGTDGKPGATSPYGYPGPTSQPASTSHPPDAATQAAMNAARAYQNLPRRESEPVNRSGPGEWGPQSQPPYPPSSGAPHGYPPPPYPLPPPPPQSHGYGVPPQSRTSSYGGEPPTPTRTGSYGGYPGPSSRTSSYGGHPTSRTGSYSTQPPLPPMGGPPPPSNYPPPQHHYADQRPPDHGLPHGYPSGPPHHPSHGPPPPPPHGYGPYPPHSHYPPPPAGSYGPPPPSSPASRTAPQLPPPHSPRQYGAPSPHAMRSPRQQPGPPPYPGPQSPRLYSGPPPPQSYPSPQRPGSSHQYGPLPPLRPPQGSPRTGSQTLLSPHSGSQALPSPHLSQSHHSPQSASQTLPSPHPGSQNHSPHPGHPSPRPSLSLPPPYHPQYHHGPPSGGAPPGYSPHHPSSPRNHPLPPPPPPPPQNNNQLPPIHTADGYGHGSQPPPGSYGLPRHPSTADPPSLPTGGSHGSNGAGTSPSSQMPPGGSRQQEFKFRHWGDPTTGRKRSSLTSAGGEPGTGQGEQPSQTGGTGQFHHNHSLPQSSATPSKPDAANAPQETRPTKESRTASRALAREERDRQKALEREQLRWNVRGVDGRGGMVKVEESAKRGPWSQWSRSEKGRERERAAAEKNWKGAAAMALAREKEQEAAEAEKAERAAAPKEQSEKEAPVTNGNATESAPTETAEAQSAAEHPDAEATSSEKPPEQQPAKAEEKAATMQPNETTEQNSAGTEQPEQTDAAADTMPATTEVAADKPVEATAVEATAAAATAPAAKTEPVADVVEKKADAAKEDAGSTEAAPAAPEAPAWSGWTAVNRR